MRLNKIIIFAVILTLVYPVNFCLAKKKRQSGVTAVGAILVDIKKNRILYSKNIHKRLEPASTAKIMTALLVLENLNLDQSVTASANACAQEPSKTNLEPGKNYKVMDLLHCVLMASSNDASACLAEAVSGSEAKFAKLMNQRAKQLGCKSTNFTNSSGLPSDCRQYSSAYDLTLIMRKLVKYPVALRAMKKKYYSFQGQDGRNFSITNHNKLLWRYPNKAIGKTGFTRSAKHCFVGNDIIGHKEIVFAILKSKSLWSDVKFLLQKAGCL